ncbi:probable multidrug resistance protein 2 [Rhynchosporium secalis]|uniref:Probable multidrug resistance protein 2 n=1 Tax=Rhynchosporium secalis TaxID=38038 RepID=A0A1E1MHW5_RHYSE|nr:probable multidrug resistance protein 2 [Rhynchosporium secalis]
MRRTTVIRGRGWATAIFERATGQTLTPSPIHRLVKPRIPAVSPFQIRNRHNSGFNKIPRASPLPVRPNQALASKPLTQSKLGLSPQWSSAVSQFRPLTTTPQLQEVQKTTDRQDLLEKEKAKRQEEEEDLKDEQDGFGRSEKASKAAQVNLSARLSSNKAPGNSAGLGEIWRLIKIARPEAKWLGLAFVFLLVSSSITMSIPFSIGKILDLATKDPSEGSTLFGLEITQFYVALGVVLTLGAAANYGRIILLRIVGERIVARLRSQLYRRTFVQNAEFFDANRVGDLLSRLSSDTVIVGKSITQNLSDGLRAIVSGAAGFTAMAWVSLKLTSILCLMFPPVAIGAFFYGRAIRNLSRKIQRNLGTLTKIAEERLGNVRTSQAFAGEIQEVGRYNHQIKKIFALGKREALISATFFSSSGFLGNMTILALLYSGGSMVKSGVISIGDLTSFLMYTAYAGSSLFGVSSFYSELMKGVGAASRLFELQDRKPTIPATVGVKVKSAQGIIKFSNVTFAYPTRPAVKIFDGLDFEIPSGTNVAIVGPSGGGKSTIGSLLLRFYNPTEGTISINGIDVSSMNGKSLRRRIGMVGQEPVLMSGSIAENIAYGKPHASRAEITAAARKANCQFISDFPDGLDTSVGARGAQLSGGQKQRIAIARALLKDPDILILDEATSALDAESETLVNSALAALLRGHNTTISIAHRLSTIKRSDHIIVLGNDGKVAETGSYPALSSNPESAFSRLMEWQMSGGDAADKRSTEQEGHLTETEEIADDISHMEDESTEEEVNEGAAARKEKQSKVEAVLEKTGKQTK